MSRADVVILLVAAEGDGASQIEQAGYRVVTTACRSEALALLHARLDIALVVLPGMPLLSRDVAVAVLKHQDETAAPALGEAHPEDHDHRRPSQH